MNTAEHAQKTLYTLLGHLGFQVEVNIQEDPETPSLQIQCPNHLVLIGEDGDRLDDLQYLVNRIIKTENPNASRVKIDCEEFRKVQEANLKQEIFELADRVIQTGKSQNLRPLNAYYRRFAYQLLLEKPEVKAESSDGDARLKRITISLLS